MARPRTKSTNRLTRDAERLVTLALALNGSGSRVEDRFWEHELDTVLGKLLQSGQDTSVEAALDSLMETHAGAYEVLVEQAETLSESVQLDKDGVSYDVLLVVAPVAAWTRYAIPAGPIRADLLTALGAHLQAHVLAGDVRLALAPELYSIDRMPRSFSATRQWLNRLGAQALGLPVPKVSQGETEVINLLADTRYLVGAVAVAQGKPVFRWQESIGDIGASREACTTRWAEQAAPLFADLLPGCGFECLLPDAYYVNNREADRRIRPLSLQAAVSWLTSAASMEPAALRAVVAGCGETELEEYRVGFTTRTSNDVIYGAVWPVFGREDDNGSDVPMIDQITALLKDLGIEDVRRLPGLLPLEHCEDCGAPFFPNPRGEMMHAEPPDEVENTPAHFH